MFGFYLEIKFPTFWKRLKPRSIVNSRSHRLLSVPCHLLFGSLGFIKSKIGAASYRETLEHFMLRSADKLYIGRVFVCQQALVPILPAKATKTASMTIEFLRSFDSQTEVSWTSMEDLWSNVKSTMSTPRFLFQFWSQITESVLDNISIKKVALLAS